jgi:hypothetical protein
MSGFRAWMRGTPEAAVVEAVVEAFAIFRESGL